MEIKPPDLTRCESLERAPHNPFSFGPKPRWERCTNAPSWVAQEAKPSEIDGYQGAMSVCEDCRSILEKMHPDKAVFFTPAEWTNAQEVARKLANAK